MESFLLKIKSAVYRGMYRGIIQILRYTAVRFFFAVPNSNIQCACLVTKVQHKGLVRSSTIVTTGEP